MKKKKLLAMAWATCGAVPSLLHIPNAIEAFHNGNHLAAALELLAHVLTLIKTLRQLHSDLRRPGKPDSDATAPVPPKK